MFIKGIDHYTIKKLRKRLAREEQENIGISDTAGVAIASGTLMILASEKKYIVDKSKLRKRKSKETFQ